ncbi:MAG: DUF3089 domain-containing protein [Xanthomonadales bacterium]|nr:DUF3089 domain-containing protein [Xanthomonadales bacterium]
MGRIPQSSMSRSAASPIRSDPRPQRWACRVRSRVRSALSGIALVLATCMHGALADTPAVASPPLDYAQPEHWLALPQRASAAMRTPRGAGFSNLQDVAVADVFYVHPTTAMRAGGRNASPDDADAARMAELMLLTQATPFNAIARIHAPRYRQITLSTYELEPEALQAPLNLAYADVLAAFRYYVEHFNHGRPFFLVAHSQGTNHAQRLLVEAIQGTALERQLVAAYLPGQPIPRAVLAAELPRLPLCTRADQVGCLLVWQTFGAGATSAELRQWRSGNPGWDARAQRWVTWAQGPLAGINPVSWDARDRRTAASRHRGAVPFGTPDTFVGLLPGLVRTRSQDGYTFVVPPQLPATHFNDGGVFGGRNLHVFDVALFWLDVRENARLRLNAWRAAHGVRAPLIQARARVVAKVGQPLRHRIRARNRVERFEVEGLPPELTLDARNGVILGTPRTAAVYALRVMARNTEGADHAELSLVIDAPR